jgi:GMP synthase-like glutamine amidotransferase
MCEKINFIKVTMRIHILQFDEKVGLGTFANWIAESGNEISTWRCNFHQWPDQDADGPLILLGGYLGVADRDRYPFLQQTADWLIRQVELGRPILAICLGSQLLAHTLGGKVYSRFHQEKGIRSIRLTDAGRQDPLFLGLSDPFISFEWHNDSFDLPAGSHHLAETADCSGQAFRYCNAWGVQFHPEVDARIVADWCQRTGAGEEPLRQFEESQQIYPTQSKQLLTNFVTEAERLLSLSAS